MNASILFVILGFSLVLSVVAVTPVQESDAMLPGVEENDGTDAAERLFLYRSMVNAPIRDEQGVILPNTENKIHKQFANDDAANMDKRVYLARVGKRKYYAARIGKK